MICRNFILKKVLQIKGQAHLAMKAELMQKTMKVVESLGKEQATRNDHSNRLIKMRAWVKNKIGEDGIAI